MIRNFLNLHDFVQFFFSNTLAIQFELGWEWYSIWCFQSYWMSRSDALFYSNFIMIFQYEVGSLFCLDPLHIFRIIFYSKLQSLKLGINCYYRQIRFEFHDSSWVCYMSKYVFHYKFIICKLWVNLCFIG